MYVYVCMYCMSRHLVCSTTAVVIIATVFVLGGFTNTALKCLQIKVNVDYANHNRKVTYIHTVQSFKLTCIHGSAYICMYVLYTNRIYT